MVDETIPQERRDFYVYVIFRPTGEPCYVGKGKGNRWKIHKRAHNTRLTRTLDKYVGSIPVVKIREGITEREAFDAEIALIRAIGRADLKLGPLYNHTDGGEGSSNLSIESRMRKSLASKAMWTAELRAATGDRFKGISLPEEHRDKISAALKGRLDNNEPGRLASPIFQKGIPLRSDILEKMRLTKKGRKLSAEHKKKLSLSGTGRKLSPQHKAAISRGNKGILRPTSPERKAALSEFWKTNNYLWWCQPDGVSYRAIERKSDLDVLGRKLR